MAKWRREFEECRIDVYDEMRNLRPSVVTDEIVQKIDENIRAGRSVKNCSP
jgi:hypothetical protein